MFAINHAATALLVKRSFPDAPLVPTLLSVQFVELLWVALNLVGVERTATEPTVRSVGDIHLLHMPFSHSIATTLLFAGAAWLLAASFGKPRLGAALAVGIASHLVLDLATHNGDIAVAPFVDAPHLGTFLYGRLPEVAFFVELAYGIVCWRVFRGNIALLTVIVVFNLANLSLFFATIPGPESLFANRPLLLVLVILLQIAVTLIAVGLTARRSWHVLPSPRSS